jgi:hypothetical protein
MYTIGIFIESFSFFRARSFSAGESLAQGDWLT